MSLSSGVAKCRPRPRPGFSLRTWAVPGDFQLCYYVRWAIPIGHFRPHVLRLDPEAPPARGLFTFRTLSRALIQSFFQIKFPLREPVKVNRLTHHHAQAAILDSELEHVVLGCTQGFGLVTVSQRASAGSSLSQEAKKPWYC